VRPYLKKRPIIKIRLEEWLKVKAPEFKPQYRKKKKKKKKKNWLLIMIVAKKNHKKKVLCYVACSLNSAQTHSKQFLYQTPFITF
jgi:hypothetical protein